MLQAGVYYYKTHHLECRGRLIVDEVSVDEMAVDKMSCCRLVYITATHTISNLGIG